MARRSSRPAPAEAAAASKRRASTRLSAPDGEVKRVKSNASLAGKSTSKKSKYFEGEDSDEPSESSESEGGESGSAYEGNESEGSADAESEPEDPEESDEEAGNVRGKGGQRKGGSGAGALKGKELWREGVRTGLGPGKEVFIPKPKARDAGDIEYQDDRLHPNTKLFLLDLAENNDREWMKGLLFLSFPSPLYFVRKPTWARLELTGLFCSSARPRLPRGKEGL